MNSHIIAISDRYEKPLHLDRYSRTDHDTDVCHRCFRKSKYALLFWYRFKNTQSVTFGLGSSAPSRYDVAD